LAVVLKEYHMSEQKQIRVLIVDDHPIVRLGMEVALSAYPDIHVVGQAHSSEHALAQCAKLQPDVILMDMVMPQVNGVEATRSIRGKFPKIQVIVFTSFQEQSMVQEALRAGAISYLLKDASSQELVTAVRTAAAGRTTLSPDVLDVLIHSIVQPSAVKTYDLSERELEVLLHMVEGLTNPEIATILVISVNTVRHHVRNILMKLEVANRTAAVKLAVDEQLVPARSAHRPDPSGSLSHG
jgi:NarL family two-component system response regulator LiaR